MMNRAGCEKHQIAYFVWDEIADWERLILAETSCPSCMLKWLDEHLDVYDQIAREFELPPDELQEFLESTVVYVYSEPSGIDINSTTGFSMSGPAFGPAYGVKLSRWCKVCRFFKEWWYRIRFAWRVLRYDEVD